MNRISFDDIFLDFASVLSMRSTCSRASVGCVITNDEWSRVLSLGYNGGARGLSNKCLSDKPGKCGHIHAEINALLKMDYGDPCYKRMYVTMSPCRDCAVAIVNARIDEVVYAELYRDKSGLELLKDAGVNLRQINYLNVED